MDLPTSQPQRPWLPMASNTMATDSTQSTDSIMSQMPIPYHIPQTVLHFSPTISQFASSQSHFAAPAYQQVPAALFNPSSMTADQAAGYQQQGPRTNHFVGQGTGYQQAESYPNQEHRNYYSQPGLQTQQIDTSMASRTHAYAYSGYAPQTSTSPALQPIQQYGGQGEVLTSRSPYPSQSYAMGYNQGMSQYRQTELQPQNGPQGAFLSNNQGNPYTSNMEAQGSGYLNNGNQYLGNRAASNHTYGPDFADGQPSYKSSGFVPDSYGRNQRYGSQNFQAQYMKQNQQYSSPHLPSQNLVPNRQYRSPRLTNQKPAQSKIWGQQSQYRSRGQNQHRGSSLAHVNAPVPEPGYIPSLTPEGISPRTIPVSVSLPQSARPNTTSPSKDIVRESLLQTPSRNGNQVNGTTTPPTIVQLIQNPTPFLRSRKGQSVSILKIDPIRGPPPAFWPETQRSTFATVPSPPESMRNAGFIAGDNGPDPFTTIGEIFNDQNQPVQNPFGGVLESRRGAVAPLVIPKQIEGGPSPHLAMIAVGTMPPSIEVALDANNLPFVETARLARPVDHGVVKISNIPYNVTRAEIIAFLGRNARLVNDADEPIHIIMERVTSKTMEAYIEFIDINEAVNSVNRYEMNRAGGRSGRLGERHVDLEVSGQECLMADLFPKARNVHWQGARPVIIPTDANDPYNTGFKGFVTNEELVMLVKHVEAPQRSPFAKECPQRPFECLISTLLKYPWYMVDYITLEDRDKLFDATKDLVSLLVNRLNDNQNEDFSIHVNDRLLRRVRNAVFRCAGFTEQQKDDIAFLCGLDGSQAGLAPFADHWSVFRTIGPKPGIEKDVLIYYIALLRESTTSTAIVSLAERSAKETLGNSSFFGNVAVDYPENVKKISLGQIAKMEWNVIEALLRQILCG